MSNQLMVKMAEKFCVPQAEMLATLKATAFKGQVSDAQMTALLIVASQYNLNPWLKEIYAFPDKGGIVPIVGVDGWSRIINENSMFDGMEFVQDDVSCTCKIFRKDRSHPISVTEYMAECKRDIAGPWKTHPKRMLRHKAMIQCARVAFGYTGIYDEDEAERIVEKEINPETKFVTEFQAKTIDAMLTKKSSNAINAFNKMYGSSSQVLRDQYDDVMAKLKQTKDAEPCNILDLPPLDDNLTIPARIEAENNGDI